MNPLNSVNEITAQYFSDNHEPRQLFAMSVEELAALPGMDKRTAEIIYSCLRYELPKEERPQIKSSQDAYDYIAPDLRGLEHEEFFAIALNQGHRVIKKIKVSQGGQAGTVVDAKIIARKLINASAKGCIVAHNHPSNQQYPSNSDKSITKDLKEGLKFLGMDLLDHIIVCDHGYYSFSDEGII